VSPSDAAIAAVAVGTRAMAPAMAVAWSQVKARAMGLLRSDLLNTCVM
jgi:hypothetical protein